MHIKPLIFLLLAAFWLLLSARLTTPFLLLGAVSALLVVIISSQARLLGSGLHTGLFYLRLIRYIPWLLWQIMLSNVKLAALILRPGLPINPRFVRMPLPQRTSLGQLAYANSVTLTPGTISTDIDKHHLEVHVLAHTDGSRKDLAETSRRVMRLEDQD